MKIEARPFGTRSRVKSIGKTSVLADCPFCEDAVLIFVWSFSGHGKKTCRCGAVLHRDGVARKHVEAAP